MVASALSHLIANVPGALAGDDPEYLHQVRVAVRRLRTMLSLARDLSLDGSLWDEDLRWLMGELSPARDWDVLVVDTLPKLDLPWAGTPNMQALLERIAERRVEANKRARAALTSGRFVRLMLEAEEGMLEAPNLGVTVDGWAIRVLDRRLKRLKRLGKDFAALDAAGRHALRIAAKRLRYSAEAFVALHGKLARSYLTRLGRLQDGLGIANDVIVAHVLLDEFARTEHAHAAGLVEGFMTSQARKRGAHLQRLYRRLIDTRPYWV
jgi:CHAD domain-containing protein